MEEHTNQTVCLALLTDIDTKFLKSTRLEAAGIGAKKAKKERIYF